MAAYFQRSKLVIHSFAKINLFLKVLNKRPDNYHNIDTLFERISLCDKMIIKNRPDNLIKITCDHPGVPLGESNLCFKAAKLLRDTFGIEKGLDIGIFKHIPVGAGLGGGSSNAASVLIALNRLWKLNLTRAKLAKLASRIGSDVSFFVYDAPFARGRGRGEKIRVLNRPAKLTLWHLLVVPGIHVSTPVIYEYFDRLSGFVLAPTGNGALGKQSAQGLTNPVSNVKISSSELVRKFSISKPGFLYNSLEQVTLKLYPEVRRVKEALAASGLNNVLMSGSGPAVFAVVPSGEKAAALVKRIKREKKPWQAFAVRTA
ncbi:MAG: 4-(cytidine 5'-diphospho)-2-C-methyl-D-erythritol kinase [Candidatus Omnitrophota bacterium]